MSTASDTTTASTASTDLTTDAATFKRLFGETWKGKCQPGALDDNTGPVAYLHDLKQTVARLEEGHATGAITLAERRPDIPALVLDEGSVNDVSSSLGQAVAVLEGAATTAVASGKTLQESVAAKASIGFDLAAERIKATLKQRQWTIWELVRGSDYAYPSFVFPAAASSELRATTTVASGLSEGLRSYLVSAAPNDASAYLSEWYDVAGSRAVNDLADMDTFRKRTGLSLARVNELLAVTGVSPSNSEPVDRQSAVVRSPNVADGTAPTDSATYGAAYINGGGQAMYIGKDGAKTMIMGAALVHFGRISRFLHLQRATKLSFAELDLLLMSASKAQAQTGAASITDATIRALGLFEHMRVRYGATTEQFCALIHQVTPYAVRAEDSFYDRLFTPKGSRGSMASSTVLTIDGGDFDPDGKTAADTRTMDLLSQALRIPVSQLRSLLALVMQAQSLATPKRSLAVVSACYRLVALPRLLGMTVADGLDLIDLLTAENASYRSQLAGVPTLTSTTATPDIVEVIVGVMEASQWLGERKLSVASLCDVLMPPPLPSSLDAQWIAAAEDYASQVEDLRITEATFTEHLATFTLRPDAVAATWMQRFEGIVRPSGLLNAMGYALSSNLKAYIQQVLEAVSSSTIDAAAQKHIDDLYDVLEANTGKQSRVYKGAVLKALGVTDPKMAYAPIRWSGRDPADVMESLLRLGKRPKDGDTSGADDSKDIDLWSRLQQKQRIFALLGLAPYVAHDMAILPHLYNHDGGGVPAYTFPANPFLGDVSLTFKTQWTPTEAIRLSTLYLIDRCQNLIDSMDTNATIVDATNYLFRATADTAATRLASLMGWREADVTALFAHLPHGTPPSFAKDLHGIDYLLRITALSKRTGLSPDALFAINAMKSDGDYTAKVTASHALTASCSDDDRRITDGEINEAWRDALMTWMLTAWVAKDTRRRSIKTRDGLSNYFLTDLLVGREVSTSLVASAIASLQMYIHRLLARLEPGHRDNPTLRSERDQWNDYRSEYPRWKLFRQIANYPENFIDPTKRRRKTQAYRDMENLLGQGKLTANDVQIAMLTYLTSFEKTSNIQALTCYEDGTSPMTDTYHFVGKTNVEPPEYYWRTLDMSMRDSDNLPSMLAWSDWEPIGLAISGILCETPLPGVPLATGKPSTIETIRPVIIAGRRYIAWVERETVGIPMGSDNKVSAFVVFRVNYAYQQSDGLWGPPNELLCLDGTDANGTFSSDRMAVHAVTKGSTPTNAYLKTPDFKPGLMVMVNTEGDRATDPWLTAVLFDATTRSTAWVRDQDYYIAARDLLLIEEKQLDATVATNQTAETTLVDEWRRFFIDPRVVQHPYTGTAMGLREVDPDKVKLQSPGGYFGTWVNHILPDPETSNSFLTADLREDNTQVNIKVSVPREWTDLDPKKIIDRKYIDASLFCIISFTDRRSSATRLPDFKAVAGTRLTMTNGVQCDVHIPIPNETVEFSVRIDLFSLTNSDSMWSYFTEGPDAPVEEEPDSAYVSTRMNLDKVYMGETLDVPTDSKWSAKMVRTFRIQKIDDDAVPSVIVKRNDAQVVYLDVSEVNKKSSIARRIGTNSIRLNTLFGKQLVALATQSVESVLSWTTQKLPEPAMAAGDAASTVDFHGANGMHFWELFFHVPFLVTWQLSQTAQYRDALDWCTRHLLDPFHSTTDTQPGQPAFWNSSPLTGSGVIVLDRPDRDPYTMAYAAPIHYRKAIFLFLVNHWQREGDHHYRRLTRDSLNNAWLCYRKALRLLADVPESARRATWTAVPLSATVDDTFVLPINPALLEARRLLRSRLYNLRHGLTLDGKIVSIPLYAEAEDPGFGGNGRTGLISGARRSGISPISHYRFKEVLPRAQRAVDGLIDLGRQLMKAYESEYDADLGVMLHANQMKLSDFTLDLQREALNSARLGRETLIASKEVISQRKTYLTGLIDKGISELENGASGLTGVSVSLKALAIPFDTAGRLMETPPNIVGLAVGGHHLGAPATAVSNALKMTGDILGYTADEMRIQSDYQRRDAQWKFELEQAKCEIAVVDRQLAEQDVLVRSADIALREIRAQRALMADEHIFMTTGTAIGPTYRRMIGEFTRLYAPAYDAVFGLCLAAEAGYRYETGDFASQYIKPRAWQDEWKGMLSGEMLQRDLMELEESYLRRHERRLHMRKTISLATATGSPTASTADNATALRNLIDTKMEIPFSLGADLFDASYPGHYLRQVVSISMSFVLKDAADATFDPDQEIAAVLTQATSSLLVRPDESGVKQFYGQAGGTEDAIVRNLRPQQQVAVSSALQQGLDGPDNILNLVLYHDGRYLPFEGTGAISTWTLAFPGDKDALMKVLKKNATTWRLQDILVHLDYTAADGGAGFAAKVSAVRKASQSKVTT